MSDLNRAYDVSGLTAGELAQARRELRAALALARPDSPARVPILARLSAVETELAELAAGSATPHHRAGLMIYLCSCGSAPMTGSGFRATCPTTPAITSGQPPGSPLQP